MRRHCPKAMAAACEAAVMDAVRWVGGSEEDLYRVIHPSGNALLSLMYLSGGAWCAACRGRDPHRAAPGCQVQQDEYGLC